MSFEHPAWLALLVAPAILWALHRRMRGPVVVRVSSVLPFQAAADQPASARPRRRVDLALLLLLVSAAALALSAAGPVLGGGGAAEVYVVVDTSASMDALIDDGRTVVEAALARARELLVLADADAQVRPLVAPTAEPVEFGGALPPRHGGDGLPGSLAQHLELARRQGFPGLLLVTDRALSLPGVVVVGPSVPPGPNFGIADVVLDGDEMVVSIRASGGDETEVLVEATGSRRVRVSPGGVAFARFPAPRIRTSVRIGRADSRWTDSLMADDEVVATRHGGARTASLEGEPPVERIRRALGASGVRNLER